MKAIVFYTTTLILLIGSFSCRDRPLITEQEKQTIIEEIKSLLDEYPKALERKDIAWIEQSYADHPDFVVALDADFRTDREAWIRETYREAFKSLDSILHFSFHDGIGHVINRDYVVYTTKFDWGIVLNADTIQSRGSGTYLYMKDEGTWRALQLSGTHEYY